VSLTGLDRETISLNHILLKRPRTLLQLGQKWMTSFMPLTTKGIQQQQPVTNQRPKQASQARVPSSYLVPVWMVALQCGHPIDT